MKQISRILFLSLLFLLLLSAAALAASIPRWPEPAWFARFSVPGAGTGSQPAPVLPAPGSGQAQPVVLTANEQHVFDAINRERVSRGLAPLRLNPQLVVLARTKSQDMIDNNYFAHLSPVFGRASDMMRSAGVRFNYASENLARTSSAANAVLLFMNSSLHRGTLLNPRFSETGVGVVASGRQIFVTQMFIGFMR